MTVSQKANIILLHKLKESCNKDATIKVWDIKEKPTCQFFFSVQNYKRQTYLKTQYKNQKERHVNNSEPSHSFTGYSDAKQRRCHHPNPEFRQELFQIIPNRFHHFTSLFFFFINPYQINRNNPKPTPKTFFLPAAVPTVTCRGATISARALVCLASCLSCMYCRNVTQNIRV